MVSLIFKPWFGLVGDPPGSKKEEVEEEEEEEELEATQNLKTVIVSVSPRIVTLTILLPFLKHCYACYFYGRYPGGQGKTVTSPGRLGRL